MIRSFTYKRWRFDSDFDKNSQFYSAIEIPPPAEMLTVNTDRNFAAIKSKIYPQEVVNLYSNLGIDIQKEMYLVHNARKQPGIHYYSVAHICFGKVLSDHRSFLNELRRFAGLTTTDHFVSIDDTCDMLISPVVYLPLLPSIEDIRNDVFMIDMQITVPWVLPDDPEPMYGS